MFFNLLEDRKIGIGVPFLKIKQIFRKLFFQVFNHRYLGYEFSKIIREIAIQIFFHFTIEGKFGFVDNSIEPNLIF